jgi:hypothetical protein
MASSQGRIPGPAEPLGEGGEQLHEWMSGIADFRYRERAETEATAGDPEADAGRGGPDGDPPQLQRRRVSLGLVTAL